MKDYSFISLKWKHYNSCKKLLENVFHISELPFFIRAWNNRSEDNSFVVTNLNVIIAFALVDNNHKIQYICVNKDFQNERIGSKLLEKIIASSTEKRSLWLATSSDERLVAWYSRYGFSVIKKEYKNGEFVSAHMVWRNRCRNASKIEKRIFDY